MNPNIKGEIRNFTGRRLTVTMLLLILAVGIVMTWWTGAMADRDYRAKMVRSASLLAEGLDLNRIRVLASTETSSNDPVYFRIKEQLAVVRSVEPGFRSIYLLVRRPDDKVCFLVDSEPTNSHNGFAGGSVYQQIPGGLRQPFTTRNPETVGPYVDRRGKWISAAIPIVDPFSISEVPATPAQAEAMVHSAVAYYKANGRERLLDAVNDPNGEFCEGTLYGFVFDRNMTLLAHPENPELVGKTLVGIKDWSGGKLYRQEIQETAQSKGKGWIEYQRLNPATGQLGPKITYIERVDDLIVCAGVPKENGHVLAELCVDADSSDWNLALTRAALPSALLTISLLALVLTAAALRKRRSLKGTPPGRKCRLECGLVFAGGLMLTSFAVWTIYERGLQNREAAFDQLAVNRSALLSDIFHGSIENGLDALGRYYQKKGWPEPGTFNQLCAFFPKDQSIRSWEWAQPVTWENRHEFEAVEILKNLKPFAIWQSDPQGRRISAPRRNVYLPVTQVAPLKLNTGILGYDLASNPLCRKALERATETGLPTAAGPVELRVADGIRQVIVLCDPFFGGGAPPRIEGFALVTLRFDPLLQEATRDQTMQLELSVLRKDSPPEILSRSSPEPFHRAHPALKVTRPIFAFGNVFVVTANSGPEFMRLHPMNNCWLAAATGLALSLLFSVLVNLYVQRRKELEKLIHERTSALAHEQELLQKLMDNAPDFIYFKDVDSRFTRINWALARHLGLKSPDEAVGRADMDFYSLAAARQKLADERRLLLTGIPMLGCVEKSETANENKWVSSSKVPIMDHAGKIAGLVGISRDITELKLMEDVLRKFSQAIEQSPTCVMITDCTGRIEYVNPRLCELTGYTASELLGQNPRIFKSGHTAKQDYRGLWRTIGAGEVWHGEFHNKKKNGEYFWESAHISPIRNASGRTTHYLGIKEDITGRKQAETEILNANRSLENATARANDLAARANAASAAKSEFLANMSHEIRTPLNGVLGMVRLLKDTPLSEEQMQYAQIAEKSGESLLQVINDILDFSKIEAQKLSLEVVNFNLHDLLENLIGAMNLHAQQKGLELACLVSPEVPANLKGDSGRLRQILTNLVGNALKFTSRGSIVVRVAVAAETAAKIKLHFTVKDTGIGIPADKIDRLFTKFTQVDSSTTRLFGGTGLGLAISKQLAELMEGEIGVTSAIGEGSEFWFDAHLAKQRVVDLETSARSPLSGLRVLVVDTHALSRETFCNLMHSWKMKPAEAADGPAALDLLAQAKAAQDPFQIVIIDLELNGMDGWTLANAIKKDHQLRETRLVMTFPFRQLPDPNRVKSHGFNAIIGKPAPRQKLKETLTSVITGTAPQDLPPRLSAADSGRLHAGCGKLLVVEDNVTNQEVARAILAKLGFDADVAANGFEAIKALESLDYGLVLMDTHMPEMDGLEAAKRIRSPDSHVLNHQVPILAMTASALDSDREKCTEAGMDEFLTKPIGIDVLLTALEKWLPASAHPQSRPHNVQPDLPDPDLATEKNPVFNRAALMDRLMEDEKVAHQIIRSFLGALPGQIANLQHMVAEGDLRKIEQQTHQIRGAAANLSAEALVSLTNTIEQSAKAGDLARVRSLAGNLEEQLRVLTDVLENEVATSSSQ